MMRTESDCTTLAIDGGSQVRSSPLPTRKLFGPKEREAIVSLMDRAVEEGSHVLSYGGEVEESYCANFAESLGGGFADGVNSGTNAVYAALAALELEPGCEVIVPPISDAGGVMPVAMLGHRPVAADAAPGCLWTDAEQIERVISDRTRAILVTHIAGLPIDMDPVLVLAESHRLKVVEDCAQAHGARYCGRAVGSLGHTAAFSTMFGKHHSTGGQGGLVFTKSEDLYWSARRWADRGKPLGLAGTSENVACTLNCNMDELHATIGRVNLERLPGFVDQRRRIAHRIAEGCRDLRAVHIVTERPDDTGSYWFLLIRLELDRLSVDRDRFAAAVSAEGITCGAGYPFFPMRMKWATERFDADATPALSNALAAESTHVRINIHEGWTESDADDVITTLTKIEATYSR